MHLNYAKRPMIRAVYHFHVYYLSREASFKKIRFHCHMRPVFNAADNPYTESDF